MAPRRCSPRDSPTVAGVRSPGKATTSPRMPPRQYSTNSSPARAPEKPHAPVQIPEDIEARVRTLCLALPEVTVRVDESRIEPRSTAYSFDIRRRSFCLLVATKGPTGKPFPRLGLRAQPHDREGFV